MSNLDSSEKGFRVTSLGEFDFLERPPTVSRVENWTDSLETAQQVKKHESTLSHL